MSGKVRTSSTTTSAATALLVILVLACAEAPAPQVSVFGAPEALAALAGEWHGEYWSAPRGRSGTVRFSLSRDGESARGEVVMIADPDRPPSPPADPSAPVIWPLPIRFVVLRDGSVKGSLEPYDDPECGCSLSTTFVGVVRGDEIEGDFTTRGSDGHPTQTGRWRVSRQPA